MIEYGKSYPMRLWTRFFTILLNRINKNILNDYFNELLELGSFRT